MRAWIPLLATLTVAAAAHAAEPARLAQTVVKGKSATVRLPFTPGDTANSNPDAVQGVVDGKSILFFGREAGEATYIVWSKDRKKTIEIDLVVADRDMSKVARQLAQELADFEGVTVRRSGGDVIVEGEVATIEELRLVNAIVSRYEGPGLRNDVATP